VIISTQIFQPQRIKEKMFRIKVVGVKRGQWWSYPWLWIKIKVISRSI